MARLLAEWGEHAALADVMEELAGDCPRRRAHNILELCGAYWPELPGLPL